jgi:ketosteroid isomerase-like protein
MSQENVERLQSLYADWVEGNFWTMDEYVDPQFEFEWKWAFAEIGGIPEGRTHSLKQLTAVWLDWLKPWDRFTVEAEEFVETDDDRVLVFYIRRARMGDSAIEHRGGTLWTFRDGTAVHAADFDDRAKALEAAGLSQ